ncbi:uncharacterized protein LOC120455835 [Drosophila santomea]|uniref:uncharacterized protein LOC120455835 n=1 Tax=Drosophila santomea TaxID=129105 RepID=UPI0019534034|nr:uncharacterized protein LOC120455835 [Drosophila santomea]
MGKHYIRVNYGFQQNKQPEELLTFEEILSLSNASPKILKQTIKILARQRFKINPNKMKNGLQYLAIAQDKEVQNGAESVKGMSFEELVVRTGVHPLHLERSLYKIALLSDNSFFG